MRSELRPFWAIACGKTALFDLDRKTVNRYYSLFRVAKHHISIRYIQPSRPQQNAHVERYNRTVRHEWLDQNIIESVKEAQDHATEWLRTYSNERPNIGIGGITNPTGRPYMPG